MHDLFSASKSSLVDVRELTIHEVIYKKEVQNWLTGHLKNDKMNSSDLRASPHRSIDYILTFSESRWGNRTARL